MLLDPQEVQERLLAMVQTDVDRMHLVVLPAKAIREKKTPARPYGC